jgi:hypothetical protein
MIYIYKNKKTGKYYNSTTTSKWFKDNQKPRFKEIRYDEELNSIINKDLNDSPYVELPKAELTSIEKARLNLYPWIEYDEDYPEDAEKFTEDLNSSVTSYYFHYDLFYDRVLYNHEVRKLKLQKINESKVYK